jgi:uncharacterized protein involved in type VI secretion and phage assembly
MPDSTPLDQALAREQRRYTGKFRAVVVDNADPDARGRLKLRVPSVLGEAVSDWALPSLPYGGASGLGFLMVPPVGAQCFAEFIEGDLSAAVWTGTYYRPADTPPEDSAAAGEPTAKLLQTESGHLLMFDDAEGAEAVTLRAKAGAEVKLDQAGSLALTDANGATVTLDATAGTLSVADANGNSLELASAGITARDAAGNEIKTTGAGVEVSGVTVKIEGSMVQVGGAGGEALVKGNSFMALFNSHTHVTGAPGSPTSPPALPLTPAALTIKTTAS